MSTGPIHLKGLAPTEEQTVYGATQNTDRHIWPLVSGPGEPQEMLHITEGGDLGINYAGHVIVKPIREWHRLALTPRAQSISGPVEEKFSREQFIEAKAWLEGQFRHSNEAGLPKDGYFTSVVLAALKHCAEEKSNG